MPDRRTVARAAIAGVVALALASPVADAATGAGSAFDAGFVFTALEGGPLPLDRFRGKAVLLVNTASHCVFTGQYADLQTVWERYRERGLVVLGVPSNDFAGQEPLDEAEIKDFCEVQFGIDFPMTAREHVRGRAAHPLYRWIADQLGGAGEPRWNFHKFLIDPEGRIVEAWPAPIAPTDTRVTAAIEAALPE